MSKRRGLRLVLASAAMTLGVGLVTMGGASAGSSWTNWAPGTGIHQVTYLGFTSSMSRSGSGIVEQWIAPGAVGGPHGAYYLYKPLSSTSLGVATPFKPSCDTLGRVGVIAAWTYTDVYGGALASYFPFPGLTYYVCQYDLSDWATGDLTYTVGSVANRHVTFSVQEAAPGFAATGTMTYADGSTSYAIDVTAVYINGTSVTFSGPYPQGSTTQWLVLQATNTGGALTWAGDVVTSDPSATLSTFVPTIVGTDVVGTMTVYTR